MTAYHGGKQRIGREIANVIYDVSTIIEKESNFKIKGYCEPFCGMLGVYQHIPELFSDHRPKLQYKAGDTNKSVIKMWKEVQKGWVPPTKSISKSRYDTIKNGSDSALKAFIGCSHSFRGVFCGSYFPQNESKIKHSSDKIRSQKNAISNIRFSDGEYTQYSNLKGFIIYCDPPYEGTMSYGDNIFDHKKFWNIMRKWSKQNIVFISEYRAPKDFVCIGSSKKYSTISGKGSRDERIEKLFVHNSFIN